MLKLRRSIIPHRPRKVERKIERRTHQIKDRKK